MRSPLRAFIELCVVGMRAIQAQIEQLLKDAKYPKKFPLIFKNDKV